ncbi:Uncharacterised protein [Canicola haemoglobinophilus]|uniref:Uncharacterized protein n=1 Tax=Canicola haemoglobinophilus TaxID=733 RepID=A0AB38H9N3_9PAST|nr:Uncharacterised protein [Canicola haemoglobinophilus]STO68668.1 Uncharacterised protein [Canicola haemoglobinophilus]
MVAKIKVSSRDATLASEKSFVNFYEKLTACINILNGHQRGVPTNTSIFYFLNNKRVSNEHKINH